MYENDQSYFCIVHFLEEFLSAMRDQQFLDYDAIVLQNNLSFRSDSNGEYL